MLIMMATNSDTIMGKMGMGSSENFNKNSEMRTSTESTAIRMELKNMNLLLILLSSKKINGYVYYTLPMISNMGRYMATIIEPTNPPSNRISMGSIIEISAVTALSTSSS